VAIKIHGTTSQLEEAELERESLVSAIEALQEHINVGFEEAKAMIRDDGLSAVATIETDEGDLPDSVDQRKRWDTAALDRPLPPGTFEERKPPLKDITYRWVDGSRDHYDDFVIYEGTDGLAGERYAIGHKPNGEKIGFVVYDDEGRSKQGITYFQRAEDITSTDELISYIRGGGTTGKGGFGPADAVPTAYEPFKTEPLADRMAGRWNRLGVVVKSDDVNAMLAHTAVQARLRELA